MTSASQRDLAKADQLAKQAHVEVTRAQLARAQTALETARIRLGYTEVPPTGGAAMMNASSPDAWSMRA